MDVRYSDLCAQWKAADATRDGVNLAFWTLIIGGILNIVTLVYLRQTFVETRKTAREAKKSSDAAVLAARTATREADLQSRPWLSIRIESISDTIRTDHWFDNADDMDYLESKVDLELWNHGTTPAIDVRVYVTIGIWDFHTPDDVTRDSFVKASLEKYELAKLEKSSENRTAGVAIFPDQKLTIKEEATLAWSSVRNNATVHEMLIYNIQGCVIYRCHGQSGTRCTSFIYDLNDPHGPINEIDEIMRDVWTDRAFTIRTPGLIDAN